MKKWSNTRNSKSRVSHAVGMQAEQRAKEFLLTQGLQFVEQNYRCKTGEIDLIMTDGEQFVFVEVKFRSQKHFGAAIDYFTPQKRLKVEKAIYHYLLKVGVNSQMTPYRLDFVAIDGEHYQWIQAI
ncbi:YraN family protein [Alteromonas sp. a30]|uniref:YraN family protein n=1 Tax=Alteromonas sp. a30 TaxID=2730917 RepID=UPI00227DEFC0|nr:YraN family protein [Alteromonas sp. a30]MCY7294799.1 YraN family protein [Alteromonas sp. a30]